MHHKNWILTSYLNDVPYGTVGGQTAYGVGAASQDVLQQAGAASSTWPRPPCWPASPRLRRSTTRSSISAAARHRREEVLQSMVQANYITQAQANPANREPLQVHPDTGCSLRREPYVFDYIEQSVARDLCPRHAQQLPDADPRRA